LYNLTMFGVLVFTASKRLIFLHMNSSLKSAIDESMPELSNTKLKVELSFLPLLVMAEMYEISHGCALQSLSSGQLHVNFIFQPGGYYSVLVVTNGRPEADRWTGVAELALRIGLGPRLERPVITEQIRLIVSTLIESAEQQLLIRRRTTADTANYEYFRTMLACFADSLYNNHGFGLLVFDGASFHGQDADRWDPIELAALVSLARRFCPTPGCDVQLKLFLNSPNQSTEPLLHRVYMHRLTGQFYAFALACMPHAAMIDRLAEVRLQIQRLLAEESMATTGRRDLLKGTIEMLDKLCGDLLQLENADDYDVFRIVMDWKLLKKFHTGKKLCSDVQMLSVLLHRLEKNIVKLIEKLDRNIDRLKLNTLCSLASVLEEGICRLDLVNATPLVSNHLDADAYLFGLLGTALQIRFGSPELINDSMLKLLYWKESQLSRMNMLCQCTDTNVFAIIRLDVLVHHLLCKDKLKRRWCDIFKLTKTKNTEVVTNRFFLIASYASHVSSTLAIEQSICLAQHLTNMFHKCWYSTLEVM
ncbi:hypothetical protein T10_6339, partial [Trichinella papuae]